jgi:hypothetical protein
VEVVDVTPHLNTPLTLRLRETSLLLLQQEMTT